MNKTAIVFIIDDDQDKLVKTLDLCSAQSIEPTLLVCTYSFVFRLPAQYKHLKVLYPMNVLDIEDIDQSFSDSFEWQKLFSQLDINGQKLANLKISNTNSPKMWAWTHLMPPHIFLHFRFLKLVHKAIETKEYQFYSIVGSHSSFPWKSTFLNQALRGSDLKSLNSRAKFNPKSKDSWLDLINIFSNPEDFDTGQYGYTKKLTDKALSYYNVRAKRGRRFFNSVTRKTKLAKKLQNLERIKEMKSDPKRAMIALVNLFGDSAYDIKLVSVGTYNRFRAKKKNIKKEIFRANKVDFKNKKNILVIISPHQAPWYFRPSSKTWEVCDEYTEGVLENLIKSTDSKTHHIHVFYMNKVTFSDEKPSYSQRYPGHVTEYPIHSFIEPLSFKHHTDLNRIENSLRDIYMSKGLKDIYSYQGTKLSLIGLKPLLGSFFTTETAYFRNKMAWDKIVDEISPDLIIGGRLEAMPYIVEVAKEKRIKTFGIKLGIAEEAIPSFLKFDSNGDLDSSGSSDINCLWGDKEVEYVSSQLPALKQNIIGIGRPRLDTFVNDSPYIDPKTVRQTLKLTDENFVILFGATICSRYGEYLPRGGGATFLGPASYKAVLKSFDELCTINKHLKILIKPWGGDDLDFIADCLTQLKNKQQFQISTNKETGLHNIQYLKCADLIVSNVSCLFGESVACGTPVINLAFPEIKYLYGSRRIESYSLISAPVEDTSEMVKKIDSLMRNEDERKTLLQNSKAQLPLIFGQLDGKIAHRIVEKALELLPKKMKRTENQSNRDPESTLVL